MTVIRLPNTMRLEAAVEWLVTEVELAGRCGISLDNLTEFARKELERPRDELHRLWAETFMQETEKFRG